jgi:hypothetical protein
MTPDYRILITKMADELDQCHQLLMDDRRQRHPLADHARALLAEPRIISRDRDETGPYVVVAESAGSAKPALADVHYEWELQDADGDWQAGGAANSLDDVRREGTRYLQTYAQDGPHKLIIRQHTTQTIDEMTNG